MSKTFTNSEILLEKCVKKCFFHVDVCANKSTKLEQLDLCHCATGLYKQTVERN